jgi:hypothetical protein
VTLRQPPHTIVYVPGTTMPAGSAAVLTKRRAVDFCRVGTAICRPQGFSLTEIQPKT